MPHGNMLAFIGEHPTTDRYGESTKGEQQCPEEMGQGRPAKAAHDVRRSRVPRHRNAGLDTYWHGLCEIAECRKKHNP